MPLTACLSALPGLLSLLSGDAHASGVVLLDQSDAVEEDRFHEELALSMDGVHLRAGPADFARTTLADQLAVIRPILAESDTSAVAWLDVSEPTLLRVSVAFVETDRAIVRLLDVPREAGAEARLALATRELLAAVYAEEVGLMAPAVTADETPPAEAEPSDASAPRLWRAGLSVGATAPLNPAAGGARGGLGGEVTRALGAWQLGGALEAQAGAAQWRVGPAVIARRGVGVAGARADWTQLTWDEQVQPRVFVGARWPSEAGLHAEARVTLAPLRDEVVRGEALLYDSGWVALSISLGWTRKIGGG